MQFLDFYSRPTEESGRESRELYVIHDDMTVHPHIGWSCAPNNPDHWWFPDHGYSIELGGGAYETMEEAVAVANYRIDCEIAELKLAKSRL